MRIVLVDIDGVVLNWKSNFRKFVKEYLGEDKWRDGPNFYTSVEDQLGITPEEADKLITEYHRSKHFTRLKAFPDAEDVIIDLNKDHGIKFIGITAVGDCNTIQQNRTTNLETLFPGCFEEIHIVGIRDSKYKYFEHYSKLGSFIWVDDTPHHAVAARKYGHNCIRLRRSYDTREVHEDHKDDVTEYTSWYDLKSVILSSMR